MLTEAVTGSDLHALAEAAHKLKAAAGSIGAAQLSDGCAQLESVARAGEPESLSPVVSRLKEKLAAVSRYLEERGGTR